MRTGKYFFQIIISPVTTVKEPIHTKNTCNISYTTTTTTYYSTYISTTIYLAALSTITIHIHINRDR